MPVQKAAPITPPPSFHTEAPFETEFVDVDVTRLWVALSVLGTATVGLTGVTTFLWRKAKRTEQSMEAMSAYVSRLVNQTDCGRVAYQTFLDEEAGVTDSETVLWDDEVAPYPQMSPEESK